MHGGGGGGVDRHAELTKEMLGNAAEMAAGTHWSQLSFKTVNLQVLPCAAPVHLPHSRHDVMCGHRDFPFPSPTRTRRPWARRRSAATTTRSSR